MRRHGWQLPYHPLQVVAIAVFLALGFAFYVFFVPFVGRKQLQYAVMGIYTPLVSSVFGIYVWCASADPGDPGVFKSKKYLNIAHSGKPSGQVQSRPSKSALPKNEASIAIAGDKPLPDADRLRENSSKELDKQNTSNCITYLLIALFGWCPFSWIWIWPCSKEQPSDNELSEDGMFYCNLCEVEVHKYSKHCRVCDKCVDGFDHHCRWLNNCIGKRNYRRFFVLMVSALLLLILQWSIGILVLVRCFLERKFFNVDIAAKLGSSFSLVPFVVVVVSCTLLAMVATLPLAQLFFFHVLLIKKGISTYDYIIALREQEQQGVPMHQSPQMTPLSSLTGLSSASSFNTFHRAAWCTPPRLFLEDQFDVIPPETGPSKRMMAIEEHGKKRTGGSVTINPWTLARLNAEEVSRAAAQARKKSRVLQPVVKREALPGQETDSSSFGSRSGQLVSRIENRRRPNKRINLPSKFALAQHPSGASDSNGSEVAGGTSSASLAPLQLEARTAFRAARAMSTGILELSPDSGLESPDIHPFRASSGTEEAREFTSIASENAAAASLQCVQLSRSTSDGYEASGGEDSDRVPSRIVHRSSNWGNLLFNSGHREAADIPRGSCSMGTRSASASHSDLA